MCRRLVCRKRAKKSIDPLSFHRGEQNSLFRFGRRAWDAVGSLSPPQQRIHMITSTPSSTFTGLAKYEAGRSRVSSVSRSNVFRRMSCSVRCGFTYFRARARLLAFSGTYHFKLAIFWRATRYSKGLGWIRGGSCVIPPADYPRSLPGLVWVTRPLYCGPGHLFGAFGPGLRWFLSYSVQPTPPGLVAGRCRVIGPPNCGTGLSVFCARLYFVLPTPSRGAGLICTDPPVA